MCQCHSLLCCPRVGVLMCLCVRPALLVPGTCVSVCTRAAGLAAVTSQHQCAQYKCLGFSVFGELIISDSDMKGCLNLRRLASAVCCTLTMFDNVRMSAAWCLQIGMRKETHAEL